MKNIQLAIIAIIMSISTAPLLYADETTETPEKDLVTATTEVKAAEEGSLGEDAEEVAGDEVTAEAQEEGSEEEYDEDTYGPEAPIIWMQPVKGVIFLHKIHTMDAGLDCDACHDDLFEMEAGAAEEKEDFIMETIYEGGYCGACHDGDSAFAANTQCATCHIGVMGAMRVNGETEEAGH